MANPVYDSLISADLSANCTREAADGDVSDLNKRFEERFHWHVLRPITDEHERLKNSDYSQSYSNWMAKYGESIEGGIASDRPILVRDPAAEGRPKTKRERKEAKESKGAKMIRLNKIKDEAIVELKGLQDIPKVRSSKT